MNNTISNKIIKHYLPLFYIGATTYCTIEVWFRGYSYRLMSIVGGICFLIIAYLKEYIPWDTPIALQMLISSIIITALEAISGNLALALCGIRMWDYSNMWLPMFNDFVCPLFSFLWFLLSGVAIVLSDSIRYYWMHDGTRPRYHIFGKLILMPKRTCC